MVPTDRIPLPAGSLDEPEAGRAYEGTLLLVRGWALFADEPVASVRVLVDGEDAGRARLGLPRPDVAALTPSTYAPACGYELLLDELTPGQHTIGAVATGLSGAQHRLPVAVITMLPARPGQSAAMPPPVPSPTFGTADDIHLLVLSHSISHEGSTLDLLDLLPALMDRHGMRSTLIGPEEGTLVRAFRDRGVAVHVTAGYGVTGPDAYEGKTAELSAWARERRVDAVLAHGTSTFIGIEVAHRLGVPGIQWMGGALPLRRQLRELHPDIHPAVEERGVAAFRDADRVIFAADATRRLYVSMGHVVPDRAHTIPITVDLSKIDSIRPSTSQRDARRRLGLDAGATIVLCIGTLVPAKGQPMLAQAFLALAQRHPTAVLVFVGGADPASRSAIDTMADRAGLGRRVRTIGPVPEVWPWFIAADLVVSASEAEGGPRVVFEALAFERPVISTRVGDVAEFLPDGTHAYLCEPRDLADLQAALDRALGASEEDRAATAAAGRGVVEQRYDLRIQADRYGELLGELFARA